MSRILITGGAGFIGSHLEPYLKKRGHDVFIMDRLRLKRDNYYRGDVFEYIRMKEIFKSVQPDAVYHFAGMISRKECEETPQMAIMFNHIGTLNVCNLTQEYNARIIYSGSSEEYGTAYNQGAIVDETTPLGIPTSMYSLTKRNAGEIVSYYEQFKNLDAISLRYCMLYGYGEDHTDYRSAISRFVHYALNNEPLTVHHNTSRGWCYITDAIEATAAMLDKSISSGEIFNIGNEREIQTETLARMIVNMCNSQSKINLIDVEPTIIPSKHVSYEKIFKTIGWKSTTPIKEGLEMVIKFQRGKS
jgi:nucleoside-diphosphate-sugar epimerase